MKSLSIRKADSSDLEILQEIGRVTFSETFSSDNEKENMQKYLEESFSAQKLVAELQNKHSQFYLLFHLERVVGYLKVNFKEAQTEEMDSEAMEIERIYILKEFQGKKLGQLLFAKALEIAKEKSASFLWLGVWEENSRAIHFYKKSGFVPFGEHVFTLGEEKQRDVLMKLEL